MDRMVILYGGRKRDEGTCDSMLVTRERTTIETDALDDESLEILTYRYLDDMTQEEIAAMLGISRKTVGKRLGEVEHAIGRLSEGAP